MSDYAIFTDSSCDLPAAMAADMGLHVLPLTVNVNGREYRNYLDERELGFSEFYSKLRGGANASTSAPNVEAFVQEMRPVLESGRDILSICFASVLSSTYQNACMAASELAPQFPERKIYCIDSKCASLGQGLLVYLCAMEKKKGRTLEEVHAFAEATKGRVCHWFTVDDLNHLKRGGRISAATALFGSMLSIKPVLHVDDGGHLVAVSKSRGRRASLTALVDRMEQTAIEPAKQTVFISHGDCLEDAQFVAGEIRRRMGVEDIRINYIGPVIGNHAGPGTVALFFVGTKR